MRPLPWRTALGCLAIVAAVGLLAGGVSWERCGLYGCPDVHRLSAFQPDGAPLVVDRYGRSVGRLQLAQRVLVHLKDLPPYVADAFISVEDKRFREHHGVDWRRVVGAFFADLEAGGSREGASTITMQLAGNLFPERISRQQQTISRKLVEARVAGKIEKVYSKDEILELYLNNIYFGGGTRGIEAASQYYFRHPARQLTLREAALLAGLPKAPTTYDPRRNPDKARERRDLVLSLMEQQGRISKRTAEAARASGLGVSRTPRTITAAEPFAGWFLEEVRRQLEDRFGDALYRQKVRVVTTLDARAQAAAERELDAQLGRIESGAWGHFTGPRYRTTMVGDEEGTDYLQGAVVYMEAATGDVLVWVGGRDFRHSHFDRVDEAKRQVGSAFKPFVYAGAIAAGVPPTQKISDEPIEVRFPDGRLWKPRNYNDEYQPQVTMREALVESMNTATVRLAEEVGIDRALQLAQSAGLPPMPSSPAVVLGAAGATPLQMTHAYSGFATLGSTVEPRFLLRIEGEKGEVLWQDEDQPRREQVVDPAVAYVLTDILQDAVRRGTGAPAAAVGLPVPAAGKTGTTNERQDVWFVGYTPDVVGTVWIGFDQPRTIVPGASGGTLAAPVWGRVVKAMYTHRQRPGGWPVPSGVEMRMVDSATGAVVGNGCPPPQGQVYREVFLAGSAPAECGASGGFWSRVQGWFGDGQTAAPMAEATPTPAEGFPPDEETEPGTEPQPSPEPTTTTDGTINLTPAAPPVTWQTPTPHASPSAAASPAPTTSTAPRTPPAKLQPVPVQPPTTLAAPTPRPRPRPTATATATPDDDDQQPEAPQPQPSATSPPPAAEPTEPPPAPEPTATPPDRRLLRT